MKNKLPLSREYVEFVTELKARIQSARISAARAVNRDVILLYWDIGRGIVERQAHLGWGKAVVETLAKDLTKEFPSTNSFSPDNLWRMRQLYAAYSDLGFLGQPVPELRVAEERATQLVAAIPWGHNLLILKRIAESRARLYYLRATAKLGWSRSVLLNQIKAQAYQRSLKAGKAHNFAAAPPLLRPTEPFCVRSPI